MCSDLPSLSQNYIDNYKKHIKINEKDYQFVQLGGNIQDNVEVFRRIQIEF
jgi:hypothetical protein